MHEIPLIRRSSKARVLPFLVLSPEAWGHVRSPSFPLTPVVCPSVRVGVIEAIFPDFSSSSFLFPTSAHRLFFFYGCVQYPFFPLFPPRKDAGCVETLFLVGLRSFFDVFAIRALLFFPFHGSRKSPLLSGMPATPVLLPVRRCVLHLSSREDRA